MHPHRIEVLDGAHHDAVVGAVAHHLELELLPPCDGLLDEDLADRAGGQTLRGEPGEPGCVGGDAGALAAEDEARPHHDRVPDLFGDLLRFAQGVGEPRSGHLESDLLHRRLEAVSVLGRGDGLRSSADHLHPETGEHAELDQAHGEVECGLAAERRQQRVRALLLDDGREHLGVERLDVGAVGGPGVGHDRGGVRVGQDHPVALLGQDPAGLGARVVELAGLADHDRAGAHDQDGSDVFAARHDVVPYRPASARPARPARADHQLVELVEEVVRVVRPGAASGWYCTENAAATGRPQALHDSVVEVHVRRLGVGDRTGRHGVVVVLARDLDRPVPNASPGWLAPWCPNGSL